MRRLSAKDFKAWEAHVAAIYQLLPKEAQQAISAGRHTAANGSIGARGAVS